MTDADTAESLAQAAAGGDPLARARLLQLLADTIYRFCLSQLGEPQQAEEATQETAIRVLESISRFHGDSRVRTWTLGVALNVCREARRGKLRHRRVSHSLPEQPDPASVDPQGVAHQRETSRRVAAAMQCLTERQRDAVTLRYFEQLSVQETACLMQVSPGTIKATVSQALAKLRLVLDHESETDDD